MWHTVGVRCWLSLLVEPHNRSRFMLLPHHLNCFLSTIEIKPIILLLLLHLPLHVLKSISLAPQLLVSRRRLLFADPWQIKVLLWGLVASLPLCLLLLLGLTHAILHQDQMSILVWTLLGLSLFDSAMEEVHSLFVLLLQLCFNALVLDVLEPVHLELGHSSVVYRLL